MPIALLKGEPTPPMPSSPELLLTLVLTAFVSAAILGVGWLLLCMVVRPGVRSRRLAQPLGEA